MARRYLQQSMLFVIGWTRSSAKLGASVILSCLALFLLLGAGNDTSSRYNALGHKLMCRCDAGTPKACNRVLLECPHAVLCNTSERMRGELKKAMQRGDNDDLILRGFVQEYGAAVLAAPTSSRGFWIITCAAVTAALLLAVYMVRSWKKRRSTVPAAPAPNLDPAALERFRQRVRKQTEDIEL